MNRIDAVFEKLRSSKNKAFIPYIAAGDPDIGATVKLVKTLDDAGADLVELGIPFSDPLADGPTIQKASQRAIASGVSVDAIFEAVRKIRRTTEVPIVFMTYYNIVLNRGLGEFVKGTRMCGADGIIVPDLPLEESEGLRAAAEEEGVCLVQLASPLTPLARFRRIARTSGGFVYYVSLTGVTGARNRLPEGLSGKVRGFRKLTRKPVCVGFGVSTPEQAMEAARFSDGVIVGSAIVRMVEKDGNDSELLLREVGGFARKLSRAVHGGKIRSGRGRK